MTVGEVVDPVMVPIAYAIAVLSVLRLLWHVARQYPMAPKRVPARIQMDGRPGRLAPKALLWLAPAALTLTLAVSGVRLLAIRPAADQRLSVTLGILLLAEVAWLAGWATDRQIELARKMTYRVAPTRTLRVLLPIVATLVALVVAAARP